MAGQVSEVSIPEGPADPTLGSGVGLEDLQKYFPKSAILWFCKTTELLQNLI